MRRRIRELYQDGSRTLACICSSFLFLLLQLSCLPASGQGTVDLRTWTQEGDLGAGMWDVAIDGSDVLQRINGAPTYFVSPNAFLGTTVAGRFVVNDLDCDDFVGFVFGYQSPLSTDSDPVDQVEYILFDWKQGPQSDAPPGFWLGKVSGTHNGSSDVDNQLWTKTSDASIAFTQLGEPIVNEGWVDDTSYTFVLVYQPDQIEIFIQGGSGTFATVQQVYDVQISDLPTGTFSGDQFPSGRFGFYNFSQPNVSYQGFTQADDPVLVTAPREGRTLQLGQTRVGTQSAAGELQILNGAAVGSLLTGTVETAGGEFSGPAPDADFSLIEQEHTTKTFVHNPQDRGIDTEEIEIISNGGEAIITLEGSGVGPVFDSLTPAGSELDFGGVSPNGMATLPLVVSNITTDVAAAELTDMTLDFEIGGADADAFGLELIPGTVISKDGGLSLEISFDARGMAGTREATLTLLTDEHAPLGDTANGSQFSWTLSATVVPEPGSLALIISALVVCLWMPSRVCGRAR